MVHVLLGLTGLLVALRKGRGKPPPTRRFADPDIEGSIGVMDRALAEEESEREPSPDSIAEDTEGTCEDSWPC